MSASTPPPRTAVSAADAPTVWIAPTPPVGHTAHSGPRLVLRARSPLYTTLDLVARFGTAVTLAALLVVTATALGVVDDRPMPTGASAGR